MIAKGAARNNPRQLAVYLMRVERYSTGEPVELLELQSAWASTIEPDSPQSRVASRLIEAFRDWQILTEGTKQGRDGLYHAEISPSPEYAAAMTPEQWKRAADILGEELGFKDQPRAIVLHGGTDGRKHMHVVWARTDIDEMKIISDGYNYVAHEKASHRMELEFGHDFVPGKHDKRDRELQEEFPRQEYDFAEAQMAERAGKTVAERKAEIRDLQAAAANGQEFKRALEEAGYLLAQGDRGYIVVDSAGAFSALTKNLQGVMKKAEVEAFMADVPLAQLPTINEAKSLQSDKALAAEPSPEKAPIAPQTKARPEMSQDERKEQIAGIRKSSDNAQAFKNALEAAGYVLAKGDKRGFVLVDSEGEVFSLSKYLAGDIKGKEYKAFMASIDKAALPSVDEATAIQERRQREAAVKPERPPHERSKFLSDELAQKLEGPASVPEKRQEQAPAEESSVQQPSPRPPIDLGYYSQERIAEREAAKNRGIEGSKFLKPVAPQQEIYAPPAPPTPTEPAPNFAPPPEQLPAAAATTKKSKRSREPLSSDPWMAQVGGVENLSPAHLESARRSYDKWELKGEYGFENYVSYVQGQWKERELPPSEIPKPTKGPKTRYVQIPPAPKPDDWTERAITPEFNQTNPQPVPDQPRKEWLPPELHQLRRQIWQEQVFKMSKHAEANAEEYKRAEQTTKNQSAAKLEDFDIRQQFKLQAAQERLQPEPRSGWRGIWDRVMNGE